MNEILGRVPVMLSPMAGSSNLPFRLIAKRFLPRGFMVSEMVNCRAIIEKNPVAWKMLKFDESEDFRSVQLFGPSAEEIGAAAKILCEKNVCDHIDLNFGCPVPKVTRRGGGSAIPLHPELLKDILQQTRRVTADFNIPLSAKFRLGIDDEHINYEASLKIAEDCGIDFATLHARSSEQYYGGEAHWDAFANALEATSLPLFANGDIFNGEIVNALLQQIAPNKVGIAIGRGALGRPWVLAEAQNALEGKSPLKITKSISEVIQIMKEHLDLSIQWFGDESKACADFRKWTVLYLKGFQIGSENKRLLTSIPSRSTAFALFDQIESANPLFSELVIKRGRTKSHQRVHLPDGWL